MSCLPLLALLMAAPQTAADKRIDGLVEKLASDDISEREKAQSELYALGPSIKPRLEAALAGASAEVSARIRVVLENFAWDERLKAALPPVARLTLERKRRTPEEIFSLIRERTGWPVRVAALNLREPVELGWTEAPVLQVLDDVCRALGRGRVQPPMIVGHGVSSPFGRSLSIDGSQPPAPCVTYWNQFRAEVDEVTIIETRDYLNFKKQASVRLLLTAQPGTTVLRAGAWIMDEITDDRGQSLKAPPRPHPGRESDLEPGEARDSVWFVSPDNRFDMYQTSDVAIEVPGPESARIGRLKARIRVTLPGLMVSETRKVSDLKEGGEIRIGGALITITKAEQKGQQFSLAYRREGKFQGQAVFEPLDENGRSLRNVGGGSGGDGVNWTANWHVRGEQVASLRIRAFVGHRTVEIPVEMSDIPLPKRD